MSGGARVAGERLARRRRIRSGRLRWAIRISAPDDAGGDVWGDVAFADDLADALRARGQHVSVDRLGTRKRSRGHWRDDVVLVLRGLVRMRPEPGVVSYLWVISHPDAVSDQELSEDWTGVYAASRLWRAGDPSITPLLQATAARFRPGAPDPDLRHDVLFVGTSRRVARPVVMDAASSGADLAVYGHDWEEFLDPRFLRGEFLEFARLPDAYRGAGRVLNDHWADMRDAGFISNRLFDAAATGARIVSDRIDGMDELFRGLVRGYDSPEELTRLLTDDNEWPDEVERYRIAELIRYEHSFDRRAEALIRRAHADYRATQRPLRAALESAIRRRFQGRP